MTVRYYRRQKDLQRNLVVKCTSSQLILQSTKMQRKALTPSRSLNRTMLPDRLASSTESLPGPRSTLRATMAPREFLAPDSALVPLGNVRPHSSRQSTASFLSTTRKPQPVNKELEMQLLYDKYLQTTMMKLLMKKKAEENEKILVSQLAVLEKEAVATSEELFRMKTNEREVKCLIELQNSLDTQLEETTALLDAYKKKPVEILKLLQSMLASLDILKCKNIIIPETSDGKNKIHELLTRSVSLLESINNMIGSKRDSVTAVDKGLKDFAKTYTDIEDCAEKAGEALQQLQLGVLKEGSDLLMAAQRDKHSAQ